MKARVINLELACFNSILNSRLETCFRGPSRPSIEQVPGRNQKPQKRGSSRTILSCKFSSDDHPFNRSQSCGGFQLGNWGYPKLAWDGWIVNGKIPSFDSWMILLRVPKNGHGNPRGYSMDDFPCSKVAEHDGQTPWKPRNARHSCVLRRDRKVMIRKVTTCVTGHCGIASPRMKKSTGRHSNLKKHRNSLKNVL